MSSHFRGSPICSVSLQIPTTQYSVMVEKSVQFLHKPIHLTLKNKILLAQGSSSGIGEMLPPNVSVDPHSGYQPEGLSKNRRHLVSAGNLITRGIPCSNNMLESWQFCFLTMLDLLAGGSSSSSRFWENGPNTLKSFRTYVTGQGCWMWTFWAVG